MYNLKNLFSVVTLLIVVNIGYGQVYPFSLVSQTPPSNIQLTNNGAPNTWGYFYLTGDGFFQTANLAIRKYAGPSTYTATCFELKPYDQDPPKKASLPTNYQSSLNSFGTKVNMPFNTGTSISWPPSQLSYNYFIFKSKKVYVEGELATCAEFHYNDAIVALDTIVGGPILNIFPNVKWINSVSAHTTSSFPGFNKKIICNFDPLMSLNDTGFVYIPMKSKVPAPSTIKIGTKLCHESTLRQDVFQVAGTPYDPNALEAYENCFYQYDGQIQMDPHKINYKVRFQNKGIGPAQNVKVQIVLDKGVDPNSVQIIDSEYPCTFTVVPTLTPSVFELKIQFNIINLPGIAQPTPTVTYEESEAWVNFRICTKHFSELHGFTQDWANYCFQHRAAIYFDQQQPVMTNTASTCISCNSSNPSGEPQRCDVFVNDRSKDDEYNGIVKVIPNPTLDYFKLSLVGPIEKAQLQIFDQTGRLVTTKQYATIDQHTMIDVSGLHIGSYTIKLTSDNELMVLRFIKQ